MLFNPGVPHLLQGHIGREICIHYDPSERPRSQLRADELRRIRFVSAWMPIISAAASSRLFCKASAYNLAASSRNLPNKASRFSFSLAARCVRACARWVVHEVANDVRPPIADPASAAKADMYAASMNFAESVAALLSPAIDLASRGARGLLSHYSENSLGPSTIALHDTFQLGPPVRRHAEAIDETSLILYMPSDGQDFADIEAYGVASWMCAAKYSAASSSCRNC